MEKIRPLGSEKLQGDEKIQRILELANYQRESSPKRHTNAEYITENVNGYVYGIVRERNDYYVKKGLNENSLDYIGGMFMKNKNKFNSYAEALKRLNLIAGQEALTEEKHKDVNEKAESEAQRKAAGAALAAKRGEMDASELYGAAKDMYDSMSEDELEDYASGVKESELHEEKKYVLKRNKTKDEAPVPEPQMDSPIDDNTPPPPDEAMDRTNDPMLDDGMSNKVGDEPETEPDLTDDESMGDEALGADDGEELRSSYMEEIQKFSGKLGQELRDQRERLESDDIKYVLNMVISAIDLDTLESDDLEEIAEKFEKRTPKFEPEPELDEPEFEPEAEVSEDFDGEDLGQKPAPEESNASLDLSKFSDLKEVGDDAMSYDELGGEEDDADIEIDLDEIMRDINASVNGTLSKYFK